MDNRIQTGLARENGRW